MNSKYQILNVGPLSPKITTVKKCYWCGWVHYGHYLI